MEHFLRLSNFFVTLKSVVASYTLSALHILSLILYLPSEFFSFCSTILCSFLFLGSPQTFELILVYVLHTYWHSKTRKLMIYYTVILGFICMKSKRFCITKYVKASLFLNVFTLHSSPNHRPLIYHSSLTYRQLIYHSSPTHRLLIYHSSPTNLQLITH